MWTYDTEERLRWTSILLRVSKLVCSLGQYLRMLSWKITLSNCNDMSKVTWLNACATWLR